MISIQRHTFLPGGPSAPGGPIPPSVPGGPIGPGNPGVPLLPASPYAHMSMVMCVRFIILAHTFWPLAPGNPLLPGVPSSPCATNRDVKRGDGNQREECKMGKSSRGGRGEKQRTKTQGRRGGTQKEELGHRKEMIWGVGGSKKKRGRK